LIRVHPKTRKRTAIILKVLIRAPATTTQIRDRWIAEGLDNNCPSYTALKILRSLEKDVIVKKEPARGKQLGWLWSLNGA